MAKRTTDRHAALPTRADTLPDLADLADPTTLPDLADLADLGTMPTERTMRHAVWTADLAHGAWSVTVWRMWSDGAWRADASVRAMSPLGARLTLPAGILLAHTENDATRERSATYGRKFLPVPRRDAERTRTGARHAFDAYAVRRRAT